MAIRTITKLLAGIEDLLLGSGTTNQERASGTQAITHIGGATLPYDNDPAFTIKDAIGAAAVGLYAHISIQNANFGKGGTAPSQVVIGNYTGWEYDVNDDSVLTIELAHDLDTTEDVFFHITWYCDENYAANSGEVQWEVQWSSVPHDESEAIDAPTHSGTVASGDIDIPTTAKHLAHSTTIAIAAGNIVSDDVIGITLTRIGLAGGNNPTAKPTVIEAHIEYTRK